MQVLEGRNEVFEEMLQEWTASEGDAIVQRKFAKIPHKQEIGSMCFCAITLSPMMWRAILMKMKIFP